MELFNILIAAYLLWIPIAIYKTMVDYYKVYQFVEDSKDEFPYLSADIFREIENSSMIYYFFRTVTFSRSASHFIEPINMIINKKYSVDALRKDIKISKEILAKIEKALQTKPVDNNDEK